MVVVEVTEILDSQRYTSFGPSEIKGVDFPAGSILQIVLSGCPHPWFFEVAGPTPAGVDIGNPKHPFCLASVPERSRYLPEDYVSSVLVRETQ